jgi:hypothetical protein
MNEKIKQLAILAGAKNITRCFGHGESHTALTLSNNTAYNSNEIDKFAELIIQECIQQIQFGIPISDPTSENDRSYTHIQRIKQHFGIKKC